VRRQKNDGNDAEAICTAARQAHIPFVPKKSVEQQDIQALHRARQRMVNHRPRLSARCAVFCSIATSRSQRVSLALDA
jgi:transposase